MRQNNKQLGGKNRVRKNEEIRISEIRLIDEEGEQLGIYETKRALYLARGKNLDLVEISPTAKPPVCKIMDFGAFLYQKKKDQKEQKKAQKTHSQKEIKFGIRISDNDFEVRIKKAIKFLEKGSSVKVVLQFKGREFTHPEIGLKRIEEMALALEEIAKQEFEPKSQGRSIVTEFRPLSKKEK
ncbi:TPA: translation initiation factor IF-3 [Candidatus Gracilibacteria bacterium]|nr:translation initiation factor IF-3 [Candidatus Gracilibacteria bacterium]HIQ57390.1 translation initiation factor IF-3 [Candidatus Gracilibacteria bacterium]